MRFGNVRGAICTCIGGVAMFAFLLSIPSAFDSGGVSAIISCLLGLMALSGIGLGCICDQLHEAARRSGSDIPRLKRRA